MNSEIKDTVLILRVPSDLKEAIQKEGEQASVTMSVIVRNILAEHYGK